MTLTMSGSSSTAAVLKPVNPSSRGADYDDCLPGVVDVLHGSSSRVVGHGYDLGLLHPAPQPLRVDPAHHNTGRHHSALDGKSPISRLQPTS